MDLKFVISSVSTIDDMWQSVIFPDMRMARADCKAGWGSELVSEQESEPC